MRDKHLCTHPHPHIHRTPVSVWRVQSHAGPTATSGLKVTTGLTGTGTGNGNGSATEIVSGAATAIASDIASVSVMEAAAGASSAACPLLALAAKTGEAQG
jgi:hypothetical protein